MSTPDSSHAAMLDSSARRPALRGPQDIQEARLRDAVSRLQVLLLRDLVSQYEADERDSDMRSDHRGWLDEEALVTRALGIYGPAATVSSTEQALVLGVLEDLRFQRFVDRLDLATSQHHAWRLRRQTEEIIDIATRFVDDHHWVPPVVDVAGVIRAASALALRESQRELPSPLSTLDQSAL